MKYGLTTKQAQINKNKYGSNEISEGKKRTIFNIIIEYDINLRSWIWSWDWDEGGEAFILGYQRLDDIDVAGQGIAF